MVDRCGCLETAAPVLRKVLASLSKASHTLEIDIKPPETVFDVIELTIAHRLTVQ